MGGFLTVWSRDENDDYENIEAKLDKRNYDCVMVFEIGENVDWKPPADGAAIQYEYLKLLKTEDIEQRKTKFPQHGADFAISRPSQMDFYKFERKLVVKALQSLNIKVARIAEMGKEFERKHGRIFYYIGARENVARRFADRIAYNLELKPQAAMIYFNFEDEPLARATLSNEQNARNILKKFWEQIYVPYNHGVAPEIYQSHSVLDKADQDDGIEESLFTIKDRCAIINQMVTQDTEVGGAGIYVPALAAKDHCMLDFFPLHTKEHLDDIVKDLFDLEHLTVRILVLPLDKLRMYYGEYIAIYFAYLQYVTLFLLPAAVLGVIYNTWQVIEEYILLDSLNVFAVIIIVWAAFFPLLWRNLEYWYSMRWGTLKFEYQEQPRPEFEGIYMRSTTDGKMFEYFPAHLRAQRRFLSLGVVLCFFAALAGSVVGIVVLRVWVANSDVDYGDYIVSFANAICIMIFNNIYGIFAKQMNAWENYRTESEYEDNLIVKVFVFRYVNSYASLYYYAFVRPFEDEDSDLYCEPETCMTSLRIQLMTIFLTQLFVSNFLELGELFVKNWFRGGFPKFGHKDTKTRVWTEFTSEVYDRTFDDYNELIIMFGYCSLFVVCFPYALLAAFLGCILEARIDGYKLCRLSRRPFPRQSDDIGSWQFCMEVMAYAVLFTNLGIMCFVSDDLDFGFLNLSNDTLEELVTALIIFFALSIVLRIANLVLNKKPPMVLMHEQRQDHITRQLNKIADRIDRYLDGMGATYLANWLRWSPTEVCNYLREVLLKNNDEFARYQKVMMEENFNGSKFSKDHEIQRIVGLVQQRASNPRVNRKEDNDDDNDDIDIDMDFGDYDYEDYNDIVIRLLINARRILEEHLNKIRDQTKALDDLDSASFGGSGGRARSRGISALHETAFRFTLDHLPHLADFFEEDFAGQSKKKLWKRVDKDESTLIEKSELSNFVYMTIVVYIKSKHPDAQLPKPNDSRLKRDIIDPLKYWLLHYKMTSGLKFDDFDRYYPTWIKEFVRERQAGQVLDEEAEQKERTMTLEAAYLLDQPTENLAGLAMESRSLRDDWKPAANVDRSDWTPLAKEWESKLDELAKSVEKSSKDTKKKLWDKFDKNKKQKLGSDKQFRTLLYSLILLHVKTKDRSAPPPNRNELEPLLIWLANGIRPMLQKSDKERKYVLRKDFVHNIGSYITKMASKGGATGSKRQRRGLFG